MFQCIYIFKDKPIVQIKNDSGLIQIYKDKIFYEVNKVHSVECYIGGYPLPDVEWAFKKCPNVSHCEGSYTRIPVKLFNTILKQIHAYCLMSIYF